MDLSLKKILIVSYGPPPYNADLLVDGGGLRCYGLAKGMVFNGLDVTLAFHSSFVKKEYPEKFDGILIKTYNFYTIGALIDEYDVVISSYSMGYITDLIVSSLKGWQKYIADCYVPSYIEVSARDSENKIEEYKNYQRDLKSWNSSLIRADAILCASNVQKTFYQGVLSSLGKINPISYKNDIIFIVPFGIFDKTVLSIPDRPIAIESDTIKLLWFGGIYPWFDIKGLLSSLEEINKIKKVKLIVVGAKNPNINHPDFLAAYENYQCLIKSPIVKDLVVDIPWVPFNERHYWYDLADYILVFNKEGLENKFSWRTRVVDFLSSDTPIITNGGDELSENLIESENAYRISTSIFSREFLDIVTSKSFSVKNRFNLRIKLNWNNVVLPVVYLIRNFPEDFKKEEIGAPIETTSSNVPFSIKVLRIYRNYPKQVLLLCIWKYIRYGRSYFAFGIPDRLLKKYSKNKNLSFQSNKGRKLTNEVCYKISNSFIGKTDDAIIYLDHSLGGGSNYYTNNLISSSKAIFFIIRWVPTGRYFNLEIFKDGILLNKYYFELFGDFQKILNSISVKKFIVGQIFSYPNISDVLSVIIEWKEKFSLEIEVLFHDFFPVCPSHNLLKPDNIYCNVPKNIDVCRACLKQKSKKKIIHSNNSDIEKWRKSWGGLFGVSDSLVFFSESSKEIFISAYGENYLKKTIVIPHKTQENLRAVNRKEKTADYICVGIIGTITSIKGSKVIRDLGEFIDKNNVLIKLYIIGEADFIPSQDCIKVLGKYKREDLPEICETLNLDLIFIPSIWPETFSYTSDEAMQMQLPLMVFDLGAPAERIKEYSLGKIIKYGMSSSEIVNSILSFSGK
jgi:hypothetical protein